MAEVEAEAGDFGGGRAHGWRLGHQGLLGGGRVGTMYGNGCSMEDVSGLSW